MKTEFSFLGELPFKVSTPVSIESKAGNGLVCSVVSKVGGLVHWVEE